MVTHAGAARLLPSRRYLYCWSVEHERGTRLDIDGGLAVLTIHRPQVRNAINVATMHELHEQLDAIEAADVHVLVVTGAGDTAFVSGGDLKELAALRTVEAAQEMAITMRQVLDRIASLPIPVVAAMNGDAYGGGAEFSVACDMRIAADDVKIVFNQVRLGVMPAWGGIERLADIVGPSRAMYLMTTGEVITAEHAQAWGLFERVVPRAEFELVWRSLARSMAEVPRASLDGIKQVLRTHRPAVHPAMMQEATRLFANTWVADDHWRMVEEMDAKRKAAKR